MNIRAIAKQDDHAAANRETAYYVALAVIEQIGADLERNRHCLVNGWRCWAFSDVLQALQGQEPIRR